MAGVPLSRMCESGTEADGIYRREREPFKRTLIKLLDKETAARARGGRPKLQKIQEQIDQEAYDEWARAYPDLAASTPNVPKRTRRRRAGERGRMKHPKAPHAR